MIRFVRNLKTLARASNMTVLISVDANLVGSHIQNSLEHLCDTVIKLTSFKEHTELKIGEYDGTIQLVKQPRIHGLICPPLSEFDIYALKLKGKHNINIEKIHLEPEQDRTGQDENLEQKGVSTKKNKSSKQGSGASSVLCNPTKSHNLDF